MAGADRDTADRTEAATPRRLQKAREEGQVPVSRELSSFAVLAGAALVLVMVAPASARRLTIALAGLLAHAHELDGLAGLRVAARAGLIAAAPFTLMAMVAAAGAVLVQTGFLIHVGTLRLDLTRLSPRAGLNRVFGGAMWLNTGTAVLKAIAAGLVLVMVLKDALPELRSAVFWSAPGLAIRFSGLLLSMLLAVVAVQGAIALFDVGRARLKHARDLRMSREDIRQEMRESEGDPLIRARLRAIRLRRARQRMMAAVPKAAVVVTNPTHYAVALAYERAIGGAPRVVAKGVDEIALRIRAIAEENRVPLVANPPLARALFRVDLDAEIPPEHFQVVAEIIAYVLRLRSRGARA
jgi:flagellar biosynthetic protein FlhB